MGRPLWREDGSVFYNVQFRIYNIFYCLRFETPPTWRTRSLYLYPPGTGLPGYTPRHWVNPSPQLNSTLQPIRTDQAENTASLLLARRVYRAIAQQRKLLDCCLHIRFLRNLFTGPLPRNIYSDFVIPTFGHHVTIQQHSNQVLQRRAARYVAYGALFLKGSTLAVDFSKSFRRLATNLSIFWWSTRTVSLTL
jgi:hypothetical protein